jgi:hypothetical protein
MLEKTGMLNSRHEALELWTAHRCYRPIPSYNHGWGQERKRGNEGGDEDLAARRS